MNIQCYSQPSEAGFTMSFSVTSSRIIRPMSVILSSGQSAVHFIEDGRAEEISATNCFHWLQNAQVPWLGLCGPETSPWSAGKSLPALLECPADDEQTLFHPFSLVCCQG